jgi:hypothetical protein
MKKALFYLSTLFHPIMLGWALIIPAIHYIGDWGFVAWCVYACVHTCIHGEMIRASWHI